MRIERLQLIGFGRFGAKVIDLAPGLNVISGPNEAGKTTLLSFIELMLYGAKKDGRMRRDYLPQHDLYRPWSGAPYEGTMVFRLEGGRRIEVFRRFDREREELRINDADTGKNLTMEFPEDKRGERLFASELLGMSRAVFVNSTLVRQLSLSEGFEETGDLSAALIKALSADDAGDNSAAKALAMLQKALDTVGKTERGGRSKQLLDELFRLEEELRSARAHKQELVSIKERSAELEGMIAGIEGELRVIQSRLSSSRADLLAAQIAKAINHREKIEEHAAGVEQYKEFAAFPLGKRDEVTRLEDRRVDLEKARAKRREAVESSQKELSGLRERLRPLLPYLSLPPNADREMIELRTKRITAKDNLKILRGQVSTDLARSEQRVNRYDELRQLFRAIGDDAVERLSRMVEEEEALKEDLLGLAEQAGRSIWQRGPYKILAMGSGILAAGSALAALVLFLLHGSGNLDTSFAWPAFGIIALLTGVVSALLARRHKRISQEGGDAAQRYEEKTRRRKELSTERRTILSLAGARDLRELVEMRAELANLEQSLSDNTALIQQRRIPQLEDDLAAIEVRMLDLMGPVGLPEGMRGQSVINESDTTTFISSFAASRELKEKVDQAEQTLKSRQNELSGLEKEGAEIAAKLAEIYGQAGVRRFAEFQQKAESKHWYDRHSRDLERHLEALEGILAGRSIEALGEELARAREESANTQSTQSDTPIDEQTYERLERRVVQLKGDARELRRERDELRGRIATMERSERDPGLIENEMELAEAEVVKIRERREALKTAISAIESASESLHADFAPVLNRAMGELAAAMTAGRYGEVMIDDDFTVATRSPESRSIVPIASLSAGARDQLYLAARMAMADLLAAGGESVPLLLDDSLVEYDLERARGAMAAVAGVAASRQVLLFTCHEREVELAREAAEKVNLVHLGGQD